MGSPAPPPEAQASSPRSRSVAWNATYFVLHLAAVYLVVEFVTPSLTGRFHHWLLPILRMPSTDGDFQFGFTHLLAFSSVPAFLLGLINAQYRHKGALLVWTVPVIVLGYKFATFPTSLFQPHFQAAFHHYFGGNFLIPEYHSYRELFEIAGANPDMQRGMDQHQITAPAYAGMAYSFAAWIGIRVRLQIPGLESLIAKQTPSDQK